MTTISGLFLYPIKSCAGLLLSEALIGRAGLEAFGVGDREWMVVTPNGDFLTQREHPRMACITPRVTSDALVIEAPGMPALRISLGIFALRSPNLHVRVWNHTCAAFDEGDNAARWLTEYLGASARLARFDPGHARPSNRAKTGDVEALNRFSDGYPLLIISEASLTNLNDRLQEAGRDALPMDRFRPNIVIRGVEAHDEDRFAALRTAGIELRPVKPCPRCPIPSIDQATGIRGDNPLEVLATYRGGPDGVLFGQNAIVVKGYGACLRLGERLDEEWNF